MLEQAHQDAPIRAQESLQAGAVGARGDPQLGIAEAAIGLLAFQELARERAGVRAAGREQGKGAQVAAASLQLLEGRRAPGEPLRGETDALGQLAHGQDGAEGALLGRSFTGPIEPRLRRPARGSKGASLREGHEQGRQRQPSPELPSRHQAAHREPGLGAWAAARP